MNVGLYGLCGHVSQHSCAVFVKVFHMLVGCHARQRLSGPEPVLIRRYFFVTNSRSFL